jgi:hypothetical protein
MKQLSIILLASILAFASCKKDDDDTTNTPTNTDNFKGRYSLNMDGNTFSTKVADVLYIVDYNRIEVKGKGSNDEVFILHINDIPSANNETFTCQEGTITLTYDGIMYNTSASNSGIITRKSDTKVIFENIVATKLMGTETKTFSGEANIGRETTL